jgi:hypothetical protein
MTLLPDTLLNLANQGASLRVDAKRISQNQLNQLAAAVADAGGTLAIVNASSLSPQQANALVALAGKRLWLDLTE